jgi:hypothetical protein
MPSFNFGRQPSAPAAPQQTVENVIEQIAKYNEYGAALRRTQSMRELAERLSQIAELAETTVTNEADDWFDAHTLKRNMSELKKFTSEFAKHANEADMLEQRMSALYDDMGHILNRYFEIQNGQPPAEPIDPAAATRPTGQAPIQDSFKKIGEADDTLPPETTMEPSPVAPAAPVDLSPKDELTVRAIKVVYKYLLQKDSDIASRFAALPATKKIEAVWKLVR